MKKTFFSILPVLLLFLILLWGLGNPDALTQGTEGFYLEIAKEMTQKNSWLTPYYLDAQHWSKPPMHFWLTMPLNLLISGHHLFISRLMMILVSLFGIFLLSKWLEKNFKVKKLFTLFYLFGTLGYLKYSRIYMMEITLMTFNLISMLYLYNYLNENCEIKKIKLKNYFNKDLFLSTLFLTFATLIKGPISLVMAALTIGIFFILGRNKNKTKVFIKKSLIFLGLSFFTSSLWFIACYLKYGFSFIEYFL